MTCIPNPPLLAIDTATPACSVALLHQDGSRQQKFEQDARKHTQLLLPMTRDLLDDAQLSMDDIAGIVVSAGPGAFTGLRVGAAVAMGIGCAQDMALSAVSSLALLAATAARTHGDGRILALLDARMGQVYAGLYDCQQGHIATLGEDCLATIEDLPQSWFAQADYAAGAGCLYAEQFPESLTTYEDVLPQAIDGFDLLLDAKWQSAWQGVQLRYLRNDVVQK
ncbi:tRNA (adenosine(37)-N6)-threonylcarbamoyltransferase complex dimerization subunit type 1 TsaB [Suttonella sp. R2A3]|uniref:tRNA (adenosine(37)-N6)-threonylcarbamoyltransferase complex dimerization subunit type 1 TsaB n=1 Tax=Suttonella sp. R2A3 TaxID=2908648 RepID=UPI001F21E19D|nr:tRNA (adenosine(37)-N6)-threonylcarbamoyltransferase complex dimerization subunit type 1 TsaB [Suttonella sp. R2A3]UJF24994.1 tRNA (adenosine(37)-N6)-threonylcarbamoyltransferase complex dimerization subunit type 1 TsaB [Suttonella sp. R2A3]